MKLLKSLSASVVLVSLMSVTSIASAGSGHPTCVDGKCYTQSQIDFYNKARKIMAQRAAAAKNFDKNNGIIQHKGGAFAGGLN